MQVRVIPLSWVYVKDGSLSKLFRQFGSQQEKFQGSMLLDVMFDSFWNDFKWKIFFSCFVPYLIYFSCALSYFMLMLVRPDEQSTIWQINARDASYIETYELPLRCALGALWFFHVCV